MLAVAVRCGGGACTKPVADNTRIGTRAEPACGAGEEM